MSACLFCDILSGKLPCDTVYEDERVLAFSDINPKAPVHKLIIPKQHIATVNDLSEAHEHLTGHMVRVATLIAKDQGVADTGYRLIMNCNEQGGQEVYHLHMHLLGGKQLTWMDGF